MPSLVKLRHKINHLRFRLGYSETPLSIWIWNFPSTLPMLLVSRNPVPCLFQAWLLWAACTPLPCPCSPGCALLGSIGSLSASLFLVQPLSLPPFTHTHHPAGCLSRTAGWLRPSILPWAPTNSPSLPLLTEPGWAGPCATGELRLSHP